MMKKLIVDDGGQDLAEYGIALAVIGLIVVDTGHRSGGNSAG